MNSITSFFFKLGLIIILSLFVIGISYSFALEPYVVAWVIDGDDYRQVPIFIGDQPFVNDHCSSDNADGCYSRGLDSIFILTGKDDHYPNFGGCSVLWHEILHAMGYDHEWMFQNLKNKDCSYSYNHRNDWIYDRYGR